MYEEYIFFLHNLKTIKHIYLCVNTCLSQIITFRCIFSNGDKFIQADMKQNQIENSIIHIRIEVQHT